MQQRYKNDALGTRMKDYEGVSSSKLTRRIPVIIRLDGKAFHTLTKKYCDDRFDDTFSGVMQSVTKFLMKQIQGVKIAYVQSDEISLLLTDYDTLETDAWFGYKVQKMCSVAASMATVCFNYYFFETQEGDVLPYHKTGKIPLPQEMGMFDARCFSIPKEEVMNYFLWRQQDCTRNSLNTYGQMNFTHKELQNKSMSDVHEMLHSIGKNWATDLTEQQKNGTFYITNPEFTEIYEKIDYNDARLNFCFV